MLVELATEPREDEICVEIVLKVVLWSNDGRSVLSPEDERKGVSVLNLDDVVVLSTNELLPETEFDPLTEWLAEDSPTDCVDNEWAVLTIFKELGDRWREVIVGSEVKLSVCNRVFVAGANGVDCNMAVEPTLKSWVANVLLFVVAEIEGSIYLDGDVKTELILLEDTSDATVETWESCLVLIATSWVETKLFDSNEAVYERLSEYDKASVEVFDPKIIDLLGISSVAVTKIVNVFFCRYEPCVSEVFEEVFDAIPVKLNEEELLGREILSDEGNPADSELSTELKDETCKLFITVLSCVLLAWIAEVSRGIDECDVELTELEGFSSGLV